MKEVKVVIGANYGDEGKGMMTRHFAIKAKDEGKSSIVVFCNGTAQRGHTVDYTADLRHVFHHFGSATLHNVSTYFADTFLIHPMAFRREYNELSSMMSKVPMAYCSHQAKVITPFDMVVDYATNEYEAKMTGDYGRGSCGYGSWCAVEGRFPQEERPYTITDFLVGNYDAIMEKVWEECLKVLDERGVDITETSFAPLVENRDTLKENFYKDLMFFKTYTTLTTFGEVWKMYDAIIFEMGQGLGLSQDVDNDYHTTSYTGLRNPAQMLDNLNIKKDYNVEVCYVTRSYLTRHGDGPFNEDKNMYFYDATNQPNPFQGTLRFGPLDVVAMYNRINDDYNTYRSGDNYRYSIAITHCNEIEPAESFKSQAEYISYNKFSVKCNIKES